MLGKNEHQGLRALPGEKSLLLKMFFCLILLTGTVFPAKKGGGVGLPMRSIEIFQTLELVKEDGKQVVRCKEIRYEYLDASGQPIAENKIPERCAPGTSFAIAIYEAGGPSSPAADFACVYQIEIEQEPAKIDEPAVYGSIKTTLAAEPQQQYQITLERECSRFVIKVWRFDSLDDKLKSRNGSLIFRRDFVSYRVYYFGLHAGVFLPLLCKGGSLYTSSYSLFYNDPGRTSPPLLLEERSYQPRAIMFAALYPWGFLPDEKPNWSWRRVHVNVGTEISKSILEKIYLGFGYDVKLGSVSVFFSFGKEDALPDQFQDFINKPIPNENVSVIPFVKRRFWRIGIVLSLPLNFAASWVGKLIGI